jgi:hypothetical protein
LERGAWALAAFAAFAAFVAFVALRAVFAVVRCVADVALEPAVFALVVFGSTRGAAVSSCRVVTLTSAVARIHEASTSRSYHDRPRASLRSTSVDRARISAHACLKLLSEDPKRRGKTRASVVCTVRHTRSLWAQVALRA